MRPENSRLPSSVNLGYSCRVTGVALMPEILDVRFDNHVVKGTLEPDPDNAGVGRGFPMQISRSIARVSALALLAAMRFTLQCTGKAAA